MQEMVTISIVTYNSRYIFNVLDQLKAELGTDSIYDIHIYDNHSETAYLEKLTTYEPFITIHRAEENQGFGHGHNQVLFNASTKYAIIFNPDVLVTKDVLDRLLNRIKIDKNIAVVSPKVLNEDGTTQYLVRQKLDVFDYMLRFIPFQFVKKIFDKRLSIYECRDLSDTETTDIKMGSGCFMLIDRENSLKLVGSMNVSSCTLKTTIYVYVLAKQAIGFSIRLLKRLFTCMKRAPIKVENCLKSLCNQWENFLTNGAGGSFNESKIRGSHRLISNENG